MTLRSKDVLEVLNHVYDPDDRGKPIGMSGRIREGDIRVVGDKIEVNYRVPGPKCPYSDALRAVIIKHALERELSAMVDVHIKPST